MKIVLSILIVYNNKLKGDKHCLNTHSRWALRLLDSAVDTIKKFSGYQWKLPMWSQNHSIHCVTEKKYLTGIVSCVPLEEGYRRHIRRQFETFPHYCGYSQIGHSKKKQTTKFLYWNCQDCYEIGLNILIHWLIVLLLWNTLN